MTVQPGDVLGAYEVVEPIGRGGMGEVYRARDSRVGRDVAIKVSGDAFGERFSREAQAIAALNHPNICTLHDVGPNYLVMELIDGPTLAERLAEGPLPLAEALATARQIADALEAAHEQGVVHRDLKPGNIKIRPDGTVKVLDFGLAKLGGTPTAVTSDSPVLTMSATQAGVILGTAAYMAPEQARGKAVDRRADIWAFGVVLHEMVTGRRLFQGEDLTDTLASVVKAEPDMSDAPASLRRLLARCLEKNPAKRVGHIAAVRELLDDARPTEAPAAAGIRSARFVPWTAAAVLALALGSLAWIHFSETPPGWPPIAFTIEAPEELRFGGAASGVPSPDGRFIVLRARSASSTSLWLRALDSPEVRRLPGAELSGEPFWSPDSRSLAFVTQDGQINVIDIAGTSAPRNLGPLPDWDKEPNPWGGGTWNRDGVLLIGGRGGLRRAAAAGGAATSLTRPSAPGESHGYPQFLPDGRRFLYVVRSGDPTILGVYASSLDVPDQRVLIGRTKGKALYVSGPGGGPGFLLYVEGTALIAQRFDAASLQRIADPVRIGPDILTTGEANFWVSDAGVLSYVADSGSFRNRSRAIWVSRDGSIIDDAMPEDAYRGVTLSLDGTRAAFSLGARQLELQGLAPRSLWVWDFARKMKSRVTFDDTTMDLNPVWSPDGRYLAYRSTRGDPNPGAIDEQIYRTDATGAGQEERLTDWPGTKLIEDWSRDGKYILYRERREDPDRWDFMALPLEGDRQPFAAVRPRFSVFDGQFSPDGRWVAYRSHDTGRGEVYVQAFDRPGVADQPAGRWQISNSGGQSPRWSADGRELYYGQPEIDADRRTINAVAIQAGPQGIQAGTPRELFSVESPGLYFSVVGNGERFLFLQRLADENLRLTVITNWQALLRP